MNWDDLYSSVSKSEDDIYLFENDMCNKKPFENEENLNINPINSNFDLIKKKIIDKKNILTENTNVRQRIKNIKRIKMKIKEKKVKKKKTKKK